MSVLIRFTLRESDTSFLDLISGVVTRPFRGNFTRKIFLFDSFSLSLLGSWVSIRRFCLPEPLILDAADVSVTLGCSLKEGLEGSRRDDDLSLENVLDGASEDVWEDF